jgi:hypothetical protein
VRGIRISFGIEPIQLFLGKRTRKVEIDRPGGYAVKGIAVAVARYPAQAIGISSS